MRRGLVLLVNSHHDPPVFSRGIRFPPVVASISLPETWRAYLMGTPANLIGGRVREARLACFPVVTQEQLAILVQLAGLSITQVQISKIENLARPVTDFELVFIAKALGVSASWLLGEE